jgi:monofunctional glycosyltransferase
MSPPLRQAPAARTTAPAAAGRRRLRRLAWGVAALGVSGVLIACVALLDMAWTWVTHRDRVAALAAAVPGRTAYMDRRAREGRPPAAVGWVPLDSLPPPVVCAVVASEHANFFRNGALDWGNQRELLHRLLRGDLTRGASGIPQQLARNLFLSPDRTARRKLREYVLAFQLSRTLSHDRMLELYLNLVEWGEGTWGVDAGSRRLFGRAPGELTPTEAILLANVLPAPARGLGFPLSPPRRGKLGRVAVLLWRQAQLDDVSLSATLARLDRLGAHVDRGLDPAAAFRAAAAEMGEEAPLSPSGAFAAGSWVSRCDLERRGVT